MMKHSISALPNLKTRVPMTKNSLPGVSTFMDTVLYERRVKKILISVCVCANILMLIVSMYGYNARSQLLSKSLIWISCLSYIHIFQTVCSHVIHWWLSNWICTHFSIFVVLDKMYMTKLKYLHIRFNELSDNSSVERLLLGCTVLEELYI